MDIDPKHRKEIESIITGFKCPKDFKCYKSGLENLCKAKDTGINEHIVCLEKFPESCVFELHFERLHFCTCPLRVYIAKNVKK